MAIKATRRVSSQQESRRPQNMERVYMVLRTLYLPASLDDTLRRQAAREGKSKNEVIREILETHVHAAA